MPDTREQLLTSTFWSIRRPKFPLTEGHFVIRLNDPSIAFGPESAADLLHCYGELRRALTDLVGATAAQLYISRNWQPVGDAIGEPIAETSTPSLHTFFVWPGSPTPAAALTRPAHRRIAAKSAGDVDEELGRWLALATAATEPGTETTPPAPEHSPALEPLESPVAGPESPAGSEGWQNRSFLVAPIDPAPGESMGAGQWSASPHSAVDSLDRMSLEALLELVHGIENLAWESSPRHVGMSVWATDLWAISMSINIFAREHGNDGRLTAFVNAGGLDLPLSSRTVRTSTSPSPTVEK